MACRRAGTLIRIGYGAKGQGDIRQRYYQVALSVLDDETRAREFYSFAKIQDNYPKTVLTLDRIGTGDYNGVQHENVIDWMLREG